MESCQRLLEKKSLNVTRWCNTPIHDIITSYFHSAQWQPLHRFASLLLRSHKNSILIHLIHFNTITCFSVSVYRQWNKYEMVTKAQPIETTCSPAVTSKPFPGHCSARLDPDFAVTLAVLVKQVKKPVHIYASCHAFKWMRGIERCACGGTAWPCAKSIVPHNTFYLKKIRVKSGEKGIKLITLPVNTPQ